MSEADDNRRKQSEALGRALAEAMDGDRLHQPQVGTPMKGPKEILSELEAKHGTNWTLADAKKLIDEQPDPIPQPTPAEPRIETVRDERAARDWLANHELPNRLVHYFNANGDEDFDHADLLSTILTEFAGRARAGSSLSLEARAETREDVLLILKQFLPFYQREDLDHFLYVCEMTDLETCSEKLADYFYQSERASPPSSPGAAQTCQHFKKTGPLAMPMGNGMLGVWRWIICDFCHAVKRYDFEKLPVDYTSDARLDEIPWMSSPGAPQEQK